MKKHHSVHHRLNEAERLALEAISEREALNLSETVRLMIREGAKRRGLWPKAESEHERD